MRLRCEACGCFVRHTRIQAYKAKQHADGSSTWRWPVIKVQPCKRCLDKTWNEAYNRGYDIGDSLSF